MDSDPSVRYVGECGKCAFAHIGLLLHDLRDLRVGTGDFDHAAHFRDRADVRFFNETLANARGCVRLRCCSSGRVKVRAFLLQELGLSETGDPQLAANRIRERVDSFADGNGAVVGDCDVAVIWLEGDRSAGAENQAAIRR